MRNERPAPIGDSGPAILNRKRHFGHSIHSHKVRSFIWAALALIFWGMFLAGVGK